VENLIKLLIINNFYVENYVEICVDKELV